jgi:hypothetical protein
MFKINNLLLFFAILLPFLTACNDDNITFAEELKAEQKVIEDFLERQKITVVTTMPETTWPADVYYKSSTGLYFQMVKKGDETIEAKGGDKIIARYIQYTLVENPDTVYNLTTIDNPDPKTFTYLNLAQVCTGWHEAIGYMKYHDSEARLIVFSKIGFSEFGRPATPVGYDLKIKIQKN